MKLGKATVNIKTTGLTKIKNDMDDIIKKSEEIKELLLQISNIFLAIKNTKIELKIEQVDKWYIPTNFTQFLILPKS